MKYLLLVLALMAGFASHLSAHPAEQVRLFAATHFETTMAGVTTKVEIYVYERPAAHGIGLSIGQTRRSCVSGVCKDVPVISGYASKPAGNEEAMINSSLERAGVHATIMFHNDVTNTDMPIRVDAVWTGTGPTRCEDPLGATECDRFATVSIEVRSGPDYLSAGETGPDGFLQLQPEIYSPALP